MQRTQLAFDLDCWKHSARFSEADEAGYASRVVCPLDSARYRCQRRAGDRHGSYRGPLPRDRARLLSCILGLAGICIGLWRAISSYSLLSPLLRTTEECLMRIWATVSLLLLTLGAYGLSLRRNPDTLVAPLDSIPTSINGWAQSAVQHLPARTLDRLLPTSYLSRSYTKNGEELNLFIAYYAQQRA